MTHHLLLYEYVENILERRAPHREAHLAHLRKGREEGRLLQAGPLGHPPHGAAIVFKDLDDELVAEFARADPYVQAGLVKHWRVELWNLVV